MKPLLAVICLTGAAFAQTTTQQRPQVGSSYVIGADDTLFISVWKQPDLTNSLPVNAKGMISMPLLGEIKAAGLTPMHLAASITEKLRKYIADPHVTVIVTHMKVCGDAPCSKGQRPKIIPTPYSFPQYPQHPIPRDLQDNPDGIIFKG